MSSLNCVQLIGRLGKDPETRTTQDGRKIVNLTLATSEEWKDKNTGEKKQNVEWHRVVVFHDRLADIIERYCAKGSQIYVQGKIATRKWTDQSGQERYSTEIVLNQFDAKLVLLSSPQRDGDAPRQRDTETRPPASSMPHGARSASASASRKNSNVGWEPKGGPRFEDDLNDEIPF